jgi:aerobic carbon-monoxide dehydrogenase medium subunit
LGLTDRPIRAARAEKLLSSGKALDEVQITEAIQSLSQDIDAMGDLTHQAATKLHMAGVLLRRAIAYGPNDEH